MGYAIAFLVLIFCANEVSCETDAHTSEEYPNGNSPMDLQFSTGLRYARAAAPLRWGKRTISKRSADEDADAGTDDLIETRDTRASPLR